MRVVGCEAREFYIWFDLIYFRADRPPLLSQPLVERCPADVPPPSHRCIQQVKQAYRNEVLPVPGPRCPAGVRVVVEHIHARLFDESLRIGEVLREERVRRTDFAARFARWTGQPPKAYVVAHQVELAKRLLRETDLSVTRVALEVGYRSHSTFSMAFKARAGRSPTDWRNSRDEKTDGENYGESEAGAR